MAASIFSHSCTVVSNLYTSAISSLDTFPTLIPASPASLPVLSVYTNQIFNSQLPFSFDIVQSISLKIPAVTIPISLQSLTPWQIANIIFFLFTVAMLSWMLDSHHSEDHIEGTISTSTTTCSTISKTEEITSLPQPPNLNLSSRPQRRRQTLETIATLVNLEDIRRSSRRKSTRSPLPCSLFSSSFNDSIRFANSAPTSPTDVRGHLISPPSGKSTSLLRRASEMESTRRKRRSNSLQEDTIKRQLEEVAVYDATMKLHIDDAERRRKGSWKTGLLLGLRVPVGWTM